MRDKLGLFPENGVPFSAIEVELPLVRKEQVYNTSIASKPRKFTRYDSWQYEGGEQWRSKKEMYELVDLLVHIDSN